MHFHLLWNVVIYNISLHCPYWHIGARWSERCLGIQTGDVITSTVLEVSLPICKCPLPFCKCLSYESWLKWVYDPISERPDNCRKNPTYKYETVTKLTTQLKNDEASYVVFHDVKMRWRDVQPIVGPFWYTDLTIESQLRDVIASHNVADTVNVLSPTTFAKWKVGWMSELI